MDLQLHGRTALITASTGGIGTAIATSLAREGATVIVNGRTATSVRSARDAIAAEVEGAHLHELVSDNGTAAGVDRTVQEHPDVDILVNNLGIYEAKDFGALTDEDWFRYFEVNVMSVVRLSRHYLPGMLHRGDGRIVSIASEAAVMPAPEMAHYSATKSAILSISRSLAELTQGSRVTSNAVVAGSTRTEGAVAFVESLYPDVPFDQAEAEFMGPGSARSTSLIRRLIAPTEIGDFVAYLSSPSAAAINGAALRVDGGLVRSII